MLSLRASGILEPTEMSLDAVVRRHRLAKAVGLAVILGGVLVWWRFVGDPGPPVSVREVPGIVTEVHEKAYVVRLDTGQTVRAYRSVDVELGAKVFLTATRHAKGDESFVLTDSGVTPP